MQHDVYRESEYYCTLGAGHFGMFAMLFRIFCGYSQFLQKVQNGEQLALGSRNGTHQMRDG